ncbi:MAG: hypothetical protein U9N62_11215 [Thermotogota bacterium]|nr:hypothetical protein [Thermotogota bacterium]
MGCYCCGNADAGWNMKYDKILCQSCFDALETIELFREKIMELATAKYNQSLDSDIKYSDNPDNNPRKDVDVFSAPML